MPKTDRPRYNKKRPTRKPYVKGKRKYQSRIPRQMYSKITDLVKSVEKKPFSITATLLSPLSLAQFTSASPGYQVINISPTPTQGDGGFIDGYPQNSQRIGNKISVQSIHCKMFLQNSPDLYNGMRIKIQLLLIPAYTSETSTQCVEQMYTGNPFTSGQIVDYNSDRDINYMNKVRVLKTVMVNMPKKVVSSTVSGEQAIRNISFGYKFKQGLTQTYLQDNFTATAQNRLVLLMLADTGNVTAAPATKVLVSHNTTCWYTDV